MEYVSSLSLTFTHFLSGGDAHSPNTRVIDPFQINPVGVSVDPSAEESLRSRHAGASPCGGTTQDCGAAAVSSLPTPRGLGGLLAELGALMGWREGAFTGQ